jgi:hypothetical protein
LRSNDSRSKAKNISATKIFPINEIYIPEKSMRRIEPLEDIAKVLVTLISLSNIN